MEPIKQLATLAGLQDRYIHAQGHTQHIALADQQAILTAMGYDLTTTEAIARQISELQQKPWAEVVAPVQVIAAQQSFSVRVQQPAASACSHWQWRSYRAAARIFGPAAGCHQRYHCSPTTE